MMALETHNLVFRSRVWKGITTKLYN